MLSVNSFKRHCYLDFIKIIVYYEEQVLIIKIKSNKQYFKYQIFSKKQEIITKSWEPRTHQSTWV